MAQRAQVEAIRPNRIPPHNLDAEQSVLGAMLESREAIANVIEIVKADDFYKPAHVEIYECITALWQRGESPDAITVADELTRRGTLENVGGKPYIHGLLEAYPTAAAAGHYAQIVEELSLLRKLIDAGNKVQEIGFSLPEDVEAAVDQAEEIIYDVSERRLRDETLPIRELLVDNMDVLEKLYERGENITGIASGFPDLDEMTAGFQPDNLIIIAARPSMGKCESGSTPIVDPLTGERLTIEQFVLERRRQVLSIDKGGAVRAHPVADWIPNGKKFCYRLTTRTGRFNEATDNHPFLTVNGWVPLSDLTPGNKIAVPARVGVFGNSSEWSNSRVRLLAYLIAEGGLTSSQVSFTNLDPVLIRDFSESAIEVFPMSEIVNRRFAYFVKKRKGAGFRNPLNTWLRELGLMGHSALTKFFPADVWKFDKPRLAEFLKILFSCDGTIYSMSGYPRIEFTVASEQLARDVQHALLRFGIIAKLWHKTEKSWRVEITQPESVETYQNEIGWLGEKEERIYIDYSKPRRSNNGHVPKEVWPMVKKAAAAKEMSLAELSRRAGEKMWSNPHTTRSLPRHRLALYAEILDSDDLRWLASPDLYWDEIVSIEPVGEQEVYDLTVPDAHNFVASDICVHNSSLLNDFALHAAAKANVPAVIFSLEMSRQELVSRFLASDARVDSQRMRRGSLQEQDWGKLSAAVGRLAEAPIFIDDSANITLMEIRAKCRRLKAKHGLGLVIIDYLQLMQSPRRSENRQQEVSEISRNLKILAKELRVPVICASQLNRGVEYRSDKRPFLGDLRESGCVTGDTRLLRADNGQEVTFMELFLSGEQNIPVMTLDEHMKIVPGTMTHVWCSGIKKVYKLTTKTGRVIRASGNHPFLTYDGWRRLDQLPIGERLAVPRRVPKPQVTTSWPDSRLILLAHMIGDGSCLRNLVTRYATQSLENAQAVMDAAAHFGVKAFCKNEPKARSMQVFMPSPHRVARGRRNPIVQWMDELGMYDKRSHEKFVPKEVFNLSNDQIALFLRHLWSTDGHVSLRTLNHSQAPTIYYATNSRRLADDVSQLLLRFGIISRITVVHKTGYRDGYHLHIRSNESWRNFVTYIGAFGPKTAGLTAIEKYLSEVRRYVSRDSIPVEVWQKVKSRMSDQGISQREMASLRGTKYGGTSHFNFPPSREVLGSYADLLKDSELNDLAHSDVYWDRVVSIEPDGEEAVFDGEVPGPHNFVSNGLVISNSIEQDADVVMFIYRDEVYNPDSEAKGEAELIVAKHRNGPTGTVRLAFMNQYTKFASIAKVPR